MNQPQSRFNSDRVCTHTIYNTYLLYDYIYFLPGRPTVCPTDYIYTNQITLDLHDHCTTYVDIYRVCLYVEMNIVLHHTL